MKPYFLLKKIGIAGILALLSAPPLAIAEIRPEKIHLADVKKNEAYLQDGLFIGGDRAINGTEIQGIRYSSQNPLFDRVVIDLNVFQDGKPPQIQRPPYFHASVDSHHKRLIFTLWGSPRLNFDSKKLIATFKKSSAVEDIKLLPRIEDDSWTFWIELQPETAVEVFELTNPVRVILDIQKKKR